MLRLLHVGMGPLGRMVARDAAARRIATIAEVVDLDPNLIGKPLRQILPESNLDTPVRGAISDVHFEKSKPFDAALLTTSSDLARCERSLRELIALGLPIVSTCEELLFPWLRHRALANDLHAACIKSGARLIGTGVNPGFLMDTLPVAATAVCKAVRSIKVSRIQDATTRRIPFQQKIGAGLDEAAFAAKVADGSLRHVGLGESLHFVAHYLGLPIGEWTETIEMVKATRALSCGLGPIPIGRCAGVRQVAFGWAPGARTSDKPVVELEFQAAIGQTDAHDRVLLDSDPPIDLVLKGGVHGDVATSAITLNCVPAIIAAPPGLHTMATVPLVRCVTPG